MPMPVWASEGKTGAQLEGQRAEKASSPLLCLCALLRPHRLDQAHPRGGLCFAQSRLRCCFIWTQPHRRTLRETSSPVSGPMAVTLTRFIPVALWRPAATPRS